MARNVTWKSMKAFSCFTCSFGEPHYPYLRIVCMLYNHPQGRSRKSRCLDVPLRRAGLSASNVFGFHASPGRQAQCCVPASLCPGQASPTATTWRSGGGMWISAWAKRPLKRQTMEETVADDVLGRPRGSFHRLRTPQNSPKWRAKYLGNFFISKRLDRRLSIPHTHTYKSHVHRRL